MIDVLAYLDLYPIPEDLDCLVWVLGPNLLEVQICLLIYPKLS